MRVIGSRCGWRVKIGSRVFYASKLLGKGFASEAAIKCKEFAFENNFTNSIISMIHPDNIASKKVAIRNGMAFSKEGNFHGMPTQIFEVLKNR